MQGCIWDLLARCLQVDNDVGMSDSELDNGGQEARARATGSLLCGVSPRLPYKIQRVVSTLYLGMLQSKQE